MHGRTGLVALLALALMPAAVSAAPIPPGTYDVQLSNASVTVSSLIAPIGMNGPVSFPVDVGSAPVTTPLGLTIPDAPVNVSVSGNTITGTVKTTVTSASATIDPVAQSAAVDISFYTRMNLNLSLLGADTCTLGSAGQPVTLHLTTAEGKPWDATTGAFQLADKSFAIPAVACSNGLIQAVVGLVVGSTGSAVIDGLATLRPVTPAGGGSTTTNTTNTTNQPTTTTPVTPAPPVTTQVAPTAKKTCKVPKLVGKSLGAAKRALKKAGCKAKVKRKKSTKKKDRVLKQGQRAGRKVPAGTTITLTVSRGKKKTRIHH